MRVSEMMSVSYGTMIDKAKVKLKGYNLRIINPDGIKSLLINGKLVVTPDGFNTFSLYDYNKEYIDEGLSAVDLIDDNVSLGRLNTLVRKKLGLK